MTPKKEQEQEQEQVPVIIAGRTPQIIAEVHRQLDLEFEDLGTVYLSRAQWEALLSKVVELKTQASN